LVISLIGPISLAFWWMIAPHFTMERFVALVAAGKYAEANKEFSLYGFSWKLLSGQPLTIEGNYTFGDPDGGFLLLMVNGEEQDRFPVCLGSGDYKLTWKEGWDKIVEFKILVTDKDGNIRNQAQTVVRSQ
jgi:hypothetical protein